MNWQRFKGTQRKLVLKLLEGTNYMFEYIKLNFDFFYKFAQFKIL